MATRALNAYRRSLPHLHLPGENRLITLRLIESLPPQLTAELLDRFGPTAGLPTADPATRKRHFAAWDAALDRAASGPIWLRTGSVARLVRDTLDDFARRDLFGLLGWTLMPNHLHVLLRLPAEPAVPFATVLHRFKTRTAQLANSKLGREGAFWESADYVLEIPDEEEALRRVILYLTQNPVRAGLVRRWDEWPHTWVGADFWQYEADWVS